MTIILYTETILLTFTLSDQNNNKQSINTNSYHYTYTNNMAYIYESIKEYQ